MQTGRQAIKKFPRCTSGYGESFTNSLVQKMQLFLAMANKKLTSLLARPTKSLVRKLPK